MAAAFPTKEVRTKAEMVQFSPRTIPRRVTVGSLAVFDVASAARRWRRGNQRPEGCSPVL
jgi:hypothetical protein